MRFQLGTHHGEGLNEAPDVLVRPDGTSVQNEWRLDRIALQDGLGMGAVRTCGMEHRIGGAVHRTNAFWINAYNAFKIPACRVRDRDNARRTGRTAPITFAMEHL